MVRNSLALVLTVCLILVSCSGDEPPETREDGPVVVISKNQD